jgi:hypothetical protein
MAERGTPPGSSGLPGVRLPRPLQVQATRHAWQDRGLARAFNEWVEIVA